MSQGLPENGSSTPPVTLKAKFLDLLESDGKSLEGLAKVLRIDITRYGETVHELVSNYERRFGQLSLRKWKFILRQLGYLEYFQQHVAADQIIADATDIDDLDDLNDEPSQATSTRWPRNDFVARNISSNSPVGKSLPVRNHLQEKHKSLKYQFKEFGPTDDQGAGKSTCDGSTVRTNEINMNAMTEGTVKMMDKTNQATRKWPEWSLPPPENMEKESTVDQGDTKDCNEPDPTLDVSTESGFFLDTSHIKNNRTPSNVLSLSPANSSPLSLVPETETDKSQCEDVTVPKAERREEESTASALHTDSSQQTDKITTSSRPTTPEAPRSLRNPLVTGHRSWQNNPGAEARLLLGNDEQLENNIDHDEESGNPAEHYDNTENNGLLTELQKENESLHRNVSFLVEELRKKNSVCTALLTQGCHLQRQLEETRGQCAQLQRTVEEHERRLEESTVLEAESQRLMRMTHELNILKQQECERLEEHIRQMDQRYDTANCRMENLNRENREMSEELRLAIGEVQNLLQEREERVRLRLDSESQLEERMAELAETFDNAETDEVKRLNQSLVREKSKTKQLEEENGILVEKNRQLRALVKQLSSKEEGSVPSGDSCKDDVGENHESNSSASNEVEANEQPGSLIYSQQSDSESSEDELFEDALDGLDSS